MKTLTKLCAVFCALGTLYNNGFSAVTTNKVNMQNIDMPTNGYWGSFKLQLLGGPDNTDGSLVKAFANAMDRRAYNIADNRLGLGSLFKNTQVALHKGGPSLDYYNNLGHGTFDSILEYSAREAVVDELPVKQWEDASASYAKKALVFLLKGSIGNTEEEDANLVSATPQSETMNPSWWQENKDKGIRSTGIRVLRRSPYAYVSFGVGHVNHRPVIVDCRLYSMLFDHNTGTPRLSVRTIIPLSERSNFNIGGELYPTTMTTTESRSRLSVRYERALFDRSWKTFYSVGAESSEKEQLLSAMLTKRF